MKFTNLVLLSVICMIFQVVIPSCVYENETYGDEESYANTSAYPPIRHNIGKTVNPDVIFPRAYSREIEKAIEENPWFGTRHTGWCGTGADEGYRTFKNILDRATFENLLPFLKHRAEYVRLATKDILKEKQVIWRNKIKAAYDKGDARIKLELLDFVEHNASSEKRFRLLDEIIHNNKLSVYMADLEHLRNIHAFKNQCYLMGKKPQDYPIDIVGFSVRLLEDHFVNDRFMALNQLASFGPDASRAVLALLELLKFEDVSARNDSGFWTAYDHSQKELAIIAIAKIGVKNNDVISALIECLDSKISLAPYAAFALHAIGDESRDYISILLGMLDDENNFGFTKQIIESIGLIGPDAKIAVSKLEEYYSSDNDKVRAITDDALENIEGKEASLARDLRNLKHENSEMRKDAIHKLSRNLDKPGVLDAIHEVMEKDDNSDVVFSACEIFDYNEGGDREKIFDAYIRVLELDGRNASHCDDVLYSIKQRGADGRKALPALYKYLETVDPNYMRSAFETVRAIGGEDKEIYVHLVNAITNKNTNMNSAIYYLGFLGCNAVDALPMLIEGSLNGSDTRYSGPISDSEKEVSRGSINAILIGCLNEGISVPDDYLLKILAFEDKKLSDTIIEIGKQSDNKTAVLDYLIEMLDSEDEDLRKRAYCYIGEMGASALPIVPLLQERRMNNAHCDPVWLILESLEAGKTYDRELLLNCIKTDFGASQSKINRIIALGVPEKSVITYLAEMVDDGYGNSDSNPLCLLTKFEHKAVIALPILRGSYDYLPDGRFDQQGGSYIAKIIEFVTPESQITVQQLVEMLDCDYDPILNATINAIKIKGGTQEDIIRRCGDNLIRTDVGLRKAGERLSSIYKFDQVKLLEYLKNYDFSNKQNWAIRDEIDLRIDGLLGIVKKESTISVEDILVFMDLGSDSHKFKAADAVARMTGNYDLAAVRLAELSSGNNKKTREFCIEVLIALAGNAKAALPVLKKIKPADSTHRELLKKAIDEIGNGEIRPIEDVAKKQPGLAVPTHPENYPYGVLSANYTPRKDLQSHTRMMLLVDVNLPEDDNSDRMLDISNWKIRYVDGTKNPNIVDVIKRNDFEKYDWTLYFEKPLEEGKELYLSIKLPGGEFSREYRFKTYRFVQ